jgi:hypothetical protein
LAFGQKVFFLRLSPYGDLSDMSCLILEALADDAIQRDLSPFNIVDAKRNAVTVPEIEFRQIAVQVLL